MTSANPEDQRATQAKLAIYRKIIAKYADVINQQETKSIPELKLLISPSEPAVLKLKDKLLHAFATRQQEAPAPEYDYARDFLPVAKAALQFLHELPQISLSDLPVSFWLSPSDLLEVGAGDEIDKNTLLCSLLLSLGNTTTKVHVFETNATRRSIVVLDHAGTGMVLDVHSGQITPALTTEKAISAHLATFGPDAKSLFEFNHETYLEF